MNRQNILSSILIQCLSLGAMDSKYQRPSLMDIDSYKKYENSTMSAASICALCEKAPDDLKYYFENWAVEQKEMLDQALPPSSKLQISREDELAYKLEFKQSISSQGFKNESPLNAALPLRVKNKLYYFKFSGWERRRLNLLATQKHSNSPDDEETLQTVSQLPVYLRLKEWITKEKITNFVIPATFASQISYRCQNGHSANDYNTILMQENMTRFEPMWLQLNKLSTVPQESINDLITAIEVGPIYDINTNLLFNDATKTFGVYDFETNWEKPSQFVFNPDAKNIKFIIASSIFALYRLAQEAAQKGQTKGAESFTNMLSERLFRDENLLSKLDASTIGVIIKIEKDILASLKEN